MCETAAYLLSGSDERLVMESLQKLTVSGEDIEMVNIFGERMKVKGRIREIDFNANRLIIAS